MLLHFLKRDFLINFIFKVVLLYLNLSICLSSTYCESTIVKQYLGLYDGQWVRVSAVLVYSDQWGDMDIYILVQR